MEKLNYYAGEEWSVNDSMSTAEINEIVSDIANGKVVGISDGSFKEGYGNDAWIIENESGTQKITGQVLVPGVFLRAKCISK